MENTHRGNDGRFFNPWIDKRKRVYADLLKWLVFSKNKYARAKKEPANFVVSRPDFEALSGDYISWLGHSTVLIKTGGRTVITDPVFWNIGPLVKRKTPLPVSPLKLPHIDYVLISHGHYDHLNTPSIKLLKDKHDPFFVTGPGYEPYFKKHGITKHIELDWWEEYNDSRIKITSLPVQHWSKRSLFDTDRMLWCSYLINKDSFKYYWIGDTGYFDGFKKVGERFGPVDVLMAPIGAYEPRWFMKRYHVNPEEALAIAKDVKAKTFIPIHWGTFDLTDEPLWLPVRKLKEIYNGREDGPVLKLLEHGGVYKP